MTSKIVARDEPRRWAGHALVRVRGRGRGRVRVRVRARARANLVCGRRGDELGRLDLVTVGLG